MRVADGVKRSSAWKQLRSAAVRCMLPSCGGPQASQSVCVKGLFCLLLCTILDVRHFKIDFYFCRCNCEPPPNKPCNPLCVALHVDQSDFFPPAAGQNSVTALSLDEQKCSAEKLSVLFLLLWKWESAAHFCHNRCSSDTNQQQMCPQRPGRSLLGLCQGSVQPSPLTLRAEKDPDWSLSSPGELKIEIGTFECKGVTLQAFSVLKCS